MNKAIKLFFISVLIFSTLQAKERVYKLKMATTWGPTQSPLIDAAKNMAKLAEELSNGQLQIRVDNANRHKAPFGILDMVKGGQYDMGHTASYYWKGKDVATLPFTSMPFGMTTPEQYSWFYYGGGLELMQKVYNKHKVYSYPGGSTGMQMGGWFQKEINSVQDLQGLKMRVPGFAGEVLAKVGVQVINIAPGEIYTALETNAIDAVEWVGPLMDINMGFQKITPYYYTGWHEPASELQFIVNQKTYKKLPPHLQKVLEVAMKLAAYDMYSQSYYMNAQAWDKMSKEYPNIKVLTFPKPVMDAMKKANEQIIEEMTSKNVEIKEVIESQNTYLKKVRSWTQISDYLYLKDNLIK